MKKDKQKKSIPFAALRKGIVGGLVGLTMIAGGGLLTGCGKDGAPGATGAQGPAGSDGATWYSGIAYSNAQGKVGDFFYDTDDFKIYHKTASGWEFLSYIRGEDGDDGDDGATWFSGTAVSGSGENIFATVVDSKIGDMYFNTTTSDVFKCIGENIWSWIANVKGDSGEDGTDGAVLNNANFMHISFDDVSLCFSNLTNNTYASLYDEPFFNWLKSMHDTYGAKFSLYAYNNALTSVPNTYADEFLQAKDWLKIGLHADNSGSNYGSSTYEQGKTAWNTFVNNVVRITGSYLSVDRMPRLHTFAGSEEALKGMRDANYGAIGFLSADDARNSYYFDQYTTDYLYYNDHITDHKNGLIFVATDLRADWFEGISASNEYREPTQTSVYDELVARYTNVEYANSVSSYIFFGHEWLIYDGTTLDSGKQHFEDACKFAQDYDIGFDFSQNKAFNPTANDLYPEGATTGGEDDQEPEVTTVMYYDTEMQIVDSISEMTFDINYAPPGGASSDFTPATVDGRATCITAVLAVNGGETIDFASNLEEIFGSINLSFAVIEFTAAPLSADTRVFNGISKDNMTDEQKAACAYAWLTEAHTLQSNTRYVIIAFKNGDGSVDFSAEQLQVLAQCLTIS